MNNYITFHRIRFIRGCIWNPSWQQRRYRYKKKWAVNLLQRTPSQLALEHFDMFYKPVYGQNWPSIRIAMLTSQKYCALVNMFGEYESVLDDLKKLGTVNMMDTAKNRAIQLTHTGNSTSNKSNFRQDGKIDFAKSKFDDVEKKPVDELLLENVNWHKSYSNTSPQVSEIIPDVDVGEVTDVDRIAKEQNRFVQTIEKTDLLSRDSDLYDFVPAETVYSNKELLLQEEVKQSTFTPADIPINTIPDSVAVPADLKVFVYKRGDARDFPTPQTDKAGVLGYYLMDAASILPVIALGLEPNDSVLDLCAAPGGKSLTILQTLKTDNIVCNDKSYMRLQRLRDVLKWYVPPSTKDRLKISKKDGNKFTEPSFNKVLVDVPCSTDRHVLTAENNLFKPGRISERLQLPTVQRDLLLAGIRSCKPGGSVVYSTCTLSPAQNEGVIQATFEFVWRKMGIDLAVQDLGPMAHMFRDTFNFHKCRFGELVLPTLTANFGPMYICKIKKLS